MTATTDTRIANGCDSGHSLDRFVVLAAKWNEEVSQWEKLGDELHDHLGGTRDRCWARAAEIARCRRELVAAIDQHNTAGQTPAANKEIV